MKKSFVLKSQSTHKGNSMARRNRSQDIIEHKFEGIVFRQRITDGYCDATDMCKANGKLFADYYRLKDTQEFIQELSLNMGIPILDLVSIKVGGKHEGTFVHPLIANDVARWCNRKFAVKVALLIEAWKQGRLEYKPKTSINHKQNPQWQQARLEGKITRKDLGETLKQYGKTSIHHISLTNQGYRALRGTDARGIRKELDLSEKANVREYLTKEELEALKFGEEVAIFSMDKQAQNGNSPSCSLAGRDMKDAVTAFKDLRRRFIS